MTTSNKKPASKEFLVEHNQNFEPLTTSLYSVDEAHSRTKYLVTVSRCYVVKGDDKKITYEFEKVNVSSPTELLKIMIEHGDSNGPAKLIVTYDNVF